MKNNKLELYDFVEFLTKYYDQINGLDMDKVIEKYNKNDLLYFFISNITMDIKLSYIYKFIFDNRVELLDSILAQILNNKFSIYSIIKNDKLIDLYLENDGELFLQKLVAKYRDKYIKYEFSNGNIKIKIEEKNNLKININGKENLIEFSNLCDLEDKIDRIYSGSEKIDDLKRTIKSLFNEQAYTCIFDDDYFIKKEEIEFLINIAKREQIREILIDLLFKSEVYILKKIAIYLIKEYDMLDYIIDKIRNEDFDFEYIFRNYEFDGELKVILELINNSKELYSDIEKALIKLINKGSYIKFIFNDKIENDKWKYKRAKVLIRFELIKQIKENLEPKMKEEFELGPMIGKIESRMVNSKSNIKEKDALKMGINEWVKYMNDFSKNPPKTTKFYEEYSISEECKVFISCMKGNFEVYFNNIDKLQEVEDYEWIYYILQGINKILKDDIDVSSYYINLFNFINNYLDKLNNIYDKPNRHKYPKKILVQEICTLINEIIIKFKSLDDGMIQTIKNIIYKLEFKIGNQDDFKKIFSGSEESYISNLINSIHYYLIRLELNFSYKLKENIVYSEYIKKLFLERIRKSPKEMYMMLGGNLYTYLAINEDYTKECINRMNIDNKRMFLSGFSNCKIISKKGYEIIKSIIDEFNISDLEDKYARSRLVEYLVLVYMLDYKDTDLNVIENKHNLDVNTIYRILSMKKTCQKLNENYTYDDFHKKQIEIWECILKNKWDEGEDELPKRTIIALREFDRLDKDIEDILIRLLNNVSNHSAISYELFNYLKSIITKENFDLVEKIVLNFKPDYLDYKLKEMFYKMKEIDCVKYRKFRNEWRVINPDFDFFD